MPSKVCSCRQGLARVAFPQRTSHLPTDPLLSAGPYTCLGRVAATPHGPRRRPLTLELELLQFSALAAESRVFRTLAGVAPPVAVVAAQMDDR